MSIDLTNYVLAKGGPWLQEKESYTPHELRLWDPSDSVTLGGPLRVRVAVQALNQLVLYDMSGVVPQARDVFSYTLDIPLGQNWTYPAPQAIVLRQKEASKEATPGPLGRSPLGPSDLRVLGEIPCFC